MMTVMVSVVMMVRRVRTNDARNSTSGSGRRRLLLMNSIAVCIIVEEVSATLIVMLVRIVMSSGKIWAADVGAQDGDPPRTRSDHASEKTEQGAFPAAARSVDEYPFSTLSTKPGHAKNIRIPGTPAEADVLEVNDRQLCCRAFDG